jgi:hypothetical protein
MGRDGKGYTTDLISEKQKYFYAPGWTRQKHQPSLICPSGSFASKGPRPSSVIDLHP